MQKSLPKAWKFINLGDVSFFKRGPFGGSLRKEIFVSDGYKVYEQKNAIYYDFNLGKYYINEDKYNEMIAFAIQPNDLIISCSGTMGKVAIVPQDAKKGIINQALLKLTANQEFVTPIYLKFVIESEAIQRKYFGNTAGSAIQNVTSVKELKKIKIPLPPLSTQHRIVEIIEEANNLRKFRQQADEKMKDLIPSLFIKMFGDPAINPKGWAKKKLGEVCYLKGRIGWRGLTKKEYTESGPIFLTGDNLKDLKVDFSSVIHISEERYFESPEIILKNDDILMTKDGTIGKLGIVQNLNQKATIGSTLALIRPNNDSLKSYYLLYFFATDYVQNRFKEKILGCSIPHIFQKDLVTIKIPISPLPLQREFAKLVEDIDAEKARQAESRKKLDELFNSLMQGAFTGELVA